MVERAIRGLMMERAARGVDEEVRCWTKRETRKP